MNGLFLKSLLLLLEGMVGVILVVAAIYGCVELLMLAFKNNK